MHFREAQGGPPLSGKAMKYKTKNNQILSIIVYHKDKPNPEFDYSI